jgi:cytochrome c5
VKHHPALPFLGLLAATSVACAPALPAPSAEGAKRVADRWPNVALADLERGRTLYAGRCARCHRLVDPASYSAARWEKEVAAMRERAGLNQAEERSILQYLVSVSAPAAAATRFEPIRTIRPLEL